MSLAARLVALAGLLLPQAAAAQMQPHRAEYALRLGSALNSPRIGTAVQDIAFDCASWRLEREVAVQVAFTPSWKVSLTSRLEAEEQRDGHAYRYRTVQVQDGIEQRTHGRVHRSDGETRAEIVAGGRPEHLILPPPTLLPIAGISELIARLRGAPAAFSALIFGAEAGDAFRVQVKELDAAALRSAPRDGKAVVPAARSWPVSLAFARRGEPDRKPLFALSARIFETGVLDRVTVDTGLVTVAADLQALEMHRAPACHH